MLYKFTANTQLGIDLLGCNAKPEAVYPQLGLSVKIANPCNFDVAFLNATGQISLQTSKGSLIHLGVPYFVSTQTPYRETYVPSRADTQAEVIVDLDWRKLEKIEEERHGDLSLKGSIHALCGCMEIGSTGADRPIESLLWMSGEIRRGNQSPFRIYQSEWIKILDAFKYGKRRILELVVPSPEEASKAILDYLEVAEKARWKGDHDAVLVSCRKAVEEIDKVLSEGKLDLKEQLQSDSKAKIVHELLKKLKEFLHKGAHTGSVITRWDADFALLLTQNLVAYVSHAAMSLPE